jgi:hypothetical protein
MAGSSERHDCLGGAKIERHHGVLPLTVKKCQFLP